MEAGVFFDAIEEIYGCVVAGVSRETVERFRENEVEESVGVAEAKGRGKAKDGVRQLTRYRDSKKKAPYLDGKAIQHGWLICPEATTAIQSSEETIGGVTWNEDSVLYQSPPKQAAMVDQQDSAIRTAKRLVLDP